MKFTTLLVSLFLTSILYSKSSLAYDSDNIDCEFDGKHGKFDLHHKEGEGSEFRIEQRRDKGDEADNDDEKKDVVLFTPQGKLKCFGASDDKRMILEVEIKSGFAHGKMRQYGTIYVDNVSRHGLTRESSYRNGLETGMRISYDRGEVGTKQTVQKGKVLSTVYYQKGKPSSLECKGAAGDESEVDMMCGYAGKVSKVTLYSSDGRERETRYFSKGKVVQIDHAKSISVMGRPSKDCKCDKENDYQCYASTAQYTDDGKLSSLTCGCIQAPANDESGPKYNALRKLCGYDGVSSLSLYSGGKGAKLISTFSLVNGVEHGTSKSFSWNTGKISNVAQYEHGISVGERIEYFEEGGGTKVAASFKHKPDSSRKKPTGVNFQRNGSMYNGSITNFDIHGKKVMESLFEEGQPTFQRKFYMNENVKLETVYVREKKSDDKYPLTKTLNKHYSDAGKLVEEETLRDNRRDGLTRHYHDNGQVAVASEYVYGRLVSQKYFSKLGGKLCSEEFEEDGSRKSVGKGGRRAECPPEGWTSVSKTSDVPTPRYGDPDDFYNDF